MDRNEMMQPVWKGNLVREESAMYILGNEDVQLMYPPKKILSVTDYTGKRLCRGVDYIETNEGLHFDPNGHAPRMSWEDMYPQEAEKDFFYRKDGGKIFFTEGGFFHQKQVLVTYTHEETDAYRPQIVCGELSRTKKKIAAGKLRVLFYGDSITCGANASAEIFFYPYQNAYPKLVAQGLRRWNEYAVIEYINTAEGGQTSAWGRQNVQQRVIDHAPDLLVLAFGMNDGTWSKDEREFEQNIRAIVEAVRGVLPETEIILVSSVLANPEPCMKFENGTLVPFAGIQAKYPPILQKLAEEYAFSFVNMTAFHAQLLERKRYYEMTGNNVNHPNDFLHRCYAQMILSLWEA